MKLVEKTCYTRETPSTSSFLLIQFNHGFYSYSVYMCSMRFKHPAVWKAHGFPGMSAWRHAGSEATLCLLEPWNLLLG